MEKRAVKKVLAIVEPRLDSDERAEHVCIAGIMPQTQTHKAGNVAAGIGAAAAAAVGGVGVMTVKQARRYYLILTDRRLIFLDMDMRHARPLTTISWTLPRQGLRVERVRSFPSGKLALFDPQGNQLCTLFFPLGVRLDATNLLKHFPGA
jgi:hypothetical protein